VEHAAFPVERRADSRERAAVLLRSEPLDIAHPSRDRGLRHAELCGDGAKGQAVFLAKTPRFNSLRRHHEHMFA
jgi:hypothetical protein